MLRPRKQVVRHSDEYASFVHGLLERRLGTTLTQQQVADGINLSRPQYSAIEGGRCMVTFDHLCSFAEFYNVTLGELLDGVGPMPRAPGTRVIICKCGRRLVGLPSSVQSCPGCKRRVKIPHEPKPDHRG